MKFKTSFEESLKELSLESIILIQGLLAQRALELITKKNESELVKPDAPKIIL